MISVTKPDWKREAPRKFWDPSRKLLRAIRLYQKNRQQDGFVASFFCKVCVIHHIFWSVVTRADIPLNCEIGANAVVVRDVEAGSVVAGVPARVIGST